MSEDLLPFTKERYEEAKARLEAQGYTVVTRWRPGLLRIRLGDIVLTPEARPDDA